MFLTKTDKVIKISIINFMLLAFLSSINLVYAKSLPVVLGLDGIAGQSTQVRIENFNSDEIVNITVTKPDNSNLMFSTKADKAGNAVIELYDYHLQKAGIYYVSAESVDKKLKTNKNSFTIFAGALDVNKSILTTERAVIKADGMDQANVSVVAQDYYGNLLDGHSIKLVSTDRNAVISPSIIHTDKKGFGTFKISNNKEGIITLMALDLAESEVLNSRIDLSFVNSNKFLADAGGDFIKVAYAAGPIAGFKIDKIPSNIKANQNVSFDVVAVDADGSTVQDYTGTIRFSAEGENSSGVNLPSNYKFLDSDLGKHTFNLGLSFVEKGTYKLVVSAVDDKFKKGEVTVVVGDGSTNSLNNGDLGNKPIINSPIAGTYSQSKQTISGIASANSQIKVYDNGQEVGVATTSPAGKFTLDIDDLSDGNHSLYVTSTDIITLSVLGTSDAVEFKIDTTAPKIDDIQFDPMTGIKAGSPINVSVFSEKNLAQAALIFNYDIIPLTASLNDPSVYVGTFQAPLEKGVYKLNVLLVDELQNEQTYENQATVSVTGEGAAVAKGDNEPKVVSPQDNNSTSTNSQNNTNKGEVVGAPSQVTGLIAYGSDKRVTLVWDAAIDDNLVKNYKVYFGDDVRNINREVNTKDASTTWYIPELENGKEYFFAVSAIDDEGNESAVRSEIVSGIPFTLEINNALSNHIPTESLDNKDLHSAAYDGPFPSNSPKTGPGLIFVIGGSSLAGAYLSRKKTKK